MEKVLSGHLRLPRCPPPLDCVRLPFIPNPLSLPVTPTPLSYQGLQKQKEKALEYTRKRRVTANVKKCAVVVCNENKVNPVNSEWKWGEDEIPIVDQYTYLGVETLKGLLLGCTHSESSRKG